MHNGSLSNHNSLREKLMRHGMTFQTENDTEVAAAYFTWRLRQGDSLRQALENGIDDLDGFYTFCVGTRDGFAVVRDPIACKPAVLAETDDWVAMATEYRAIAQLPGVEKARIWEPAPQTIYTWEGRRREIVRQSSPNRACAPSTQRLHRLTARQPTSGHFRVANPHGAHAIAVGVDEPVPIEIDGHVGYYCGGMNKRRRDHGQRPCRAGRRREHDGGLGAGSNGNASQSAGATGNGGLLVIEGDASSRCGISMKGIDIVVGGSVGHMSAFMAQAGSLVVLRRCRRSARRFDL